MRLDEQYWSKRYINGQTQWDIGYVSDPIKAYVDQLENKELRILIPGCGNSYEAQYLHESGFSNVFLVDISSLPLRTFSERCPGFPNSNLINDDFFNLTDKFDLIIEQTFFCSLNPGDRVDYARKMQELLSTEGKLVGVLFDDELFRDHPPYGGFKEDYIPIFRDCSRYLENSDFTFLGRWKYFTPSMMFNMHRSRNMA